MDPSLDLLSIVSPPPPLKKSNTELSSNVNSDINRMAVMWDYTANGEHVLLSLVHPSGCYHQCFSTIDCTVCIV